MNLYYWQIVYEKKSKENFSIQINIEWEKAFRIDWSCAKIHHQWKKNHKKNPPVYLDFTNLRADPTFEEFHNILVWVLF